MQFAVLRDAEIGGDRRELRSLGRVYLQRRLRREHDACTGPHGDPLFETIAAEHTRTGADQDHVGRPVEVEAVPGAERRFGIGVREDRPPVPTLEVQLETRGPPDGGR